MKKHILYITTACLLLIVQPISANYEPPISSSTLVVSKLPESDKSHILLARLDEINAMDKTNLSSAEKRQLRKEVKSIRRQLNDVENGVYISVGAIVIIALLLIIFF